MVVAAAVVVVVCGWVCGGKAVWRGGTGAMGRGLCVMKGTELEKLWNGRRHSYSFYSALMSRHTRARGARFGDGEVGRGPCVVACGGR